VLVVAGVAVGSILPLPARTKVVTPLGTAPGHRPQPRQRAEPPPFPRAQAMRTGSARRHDKARTGFRASRLSTSSWAHWDHVAELLLKAAQTRKKSDIEAASAQERVLRRDNCL
jgi:hypothetical protein